MPKTGVPKSTKLNMKLTEFKIQVNARKFSAFAINEQEAVCIVIRRMGRKLTEADVLTVNGVIVK